MLSHDAAFNTFGFTWHFLLHRALFGVISFFSLNYSFTKTRLISMIITSHMRVVPKVMSNFYLHANWKQQTKESAVVDGTSCCVILDCLVTSIACIT